VTLARLQLPDLVAWPGSETKGHFTAEGETKETVRGIFEGGPQSSDFNAALLRLTANSAKIAGPRKKVFLPRSSGACIFRSRKLLTGQGSPSATTDRRCVASLEVVTGLVKAGHYPAPPARRVSTLHELRCRRTSGREIHVVFDNLNTHKPNHDRWVEARLMHWQRKAEEGGGHEWPLSRGRASAGLPGLRVQSRVPRLGSARRARAAGHSAVLPMPTGKGRHRLLWRAGLK